MLFINSVKYICGFLHKGSQNSPKGTNVVSKRKPCETKINRDLMKACQANMDIQFIIDVYACVMYIASYMMKKERGMCELLKQVGRYYKATKTIWDRQFFTS